MVLPGIGSHSPFFQSRTSNGIASSPGVSCWVGTSTTSCSTPSTPGAMSLTARATPLKMSQSLRDSHAGSTALVSGWMNGCMSDVLRSFFSYQVRSEEHTSELQSLMRISYAVFCLKKKNKTVNTKQYSKHNTIIKEI